MEYYSTIEKSKIFPFSAVSINIEDISETEKGKQLYTDMWNREYSINESVYKNRLTDKENKLMVTKRVMDKLEVWDEVIQVSIDTTYKQPRIYHIAQGIISNIL